MINIGKYIEMAINWLTENFAGLFDVINHIVGGFIDGFQGILMWVPFYLMIAGIAALAWWKAGKGTAVLTLLGLLLLFLDSLVRLRTVLSVFRIRKDIYAGY